MAALQRFVLIVFTACPSLVFAQVDVNELLNKLKNPGPQVYSCSPEQKGCSEMYNNFCKTLFSKEHLGNIDIASGDEKFQIRVGKAKNGFSNEAFEYGRAKLDAIKNKRVPDDFLKNLNPDYVPQLEAYLNSKPSDQMTDQEKLDFDQKGSELSYLFNSAWQKTIHERVTTKFPGYYSNKRKDYHLAETIEANKISDQFHSDFYKILWDKNTKFLKAKADFEETKAAYLKYLDETDELTSTDKAKFKSWISTVTLEAPAGDDPSNFDANCASTENNAFYQPSVHKIKICAGLFNSGQSNQFVFAHELSHALGLTRAMTVRQDQSELAKKTKQLITSVCTETSRGKCPAEWAEYKANFGKMIKAQGSVEPPLKAYRECLRLNPQQIRPIIGKDNKSENPDYTSFVKSKAEEYATQLTDGYATGNDFTSWVVDKLPLDPDTGKTEKNPQQYNPCSDIDYVENTTYSPLGEVFDRTAFTAEYLCSKAATDAEKMKGAISTLASVKAVIYQDYLRFGGSLSASADVTSRHFSEDTEERFADAMGNRVFSRLVEQKYPVSTEDWQTKRRNFFLSATPLFCEKPNMANEHPDLAKIEAAHSTESHSTADQRRMDFVNDPMRGILGCKKDNSNKECKP